MTEAEALDMAAWAAGWGDYNIALYHDGDTESIRAHAKTIMENAALKAEIERLREALRPFTFLEMEKDEGLADTQYVWETIYSDRVQDWFSYEEIETARAALKEIEG